MRWWSTDNNSDLGAKGNYFLMLRIYRSLACAGVPCTATDLSLMRPALVIGYPRCRLSASSMKVSLTLTAIVDQVALPSHVLGLSFLACRRVFYCTHDAINQLDRNSIEMAQPARIVPHMCSACVSSENL